MKYLLDTHVLIWFRIDPKRLGEAALSLLREPATPVVISAVSTLEVAQLSFSGRLVLSCDPETWMRQARELFNASEIGMDSKTASEAYRLPDAFHKDPADRLLVATARLHGLTLVTADRRILDYPHVGTIDARI